MLIFAILSFDRGDTCRRGKPNGSSMPVICPGRMPVFLLGWLCAGLAALPAQEAAAAGLAPLRVDPALLGEAPRSAPRTPAAPAPIQPAEPPALRAATVPKPVAAPRPAAPAPRSVPGSATETPAPAPPARRPANAPIATPAAKPSPPAQGLLPEPVPPGVTQLSASKLGGTTDKVTEAEGEVRLWRDDSAIAADRLRYLHDEDTVEASGNVTITQKHDVVSGPEMRLRLTDRVGHIDQPRYSIQRAARGTQAGRPVTASGTADRLEFRGEDRYRLANATYSTCGPDRPDWVLAVRDLDLDFEKEVGTARGAKVVFKDVPLFYAPWMDFALNNRRKTGILPPTLGNSSRTGIDVSLPFYWNIAPNLDATIAPRIMTRRGAQLGGEFRYLEPTYVGAAQIEWLPNDNVTDRRRSFYSWQHAQSLAPGLSGTINVAGVSDDTYFSDLSTHIAVTSQRNLLRQGSLSYEGEGWNSAVYVQRYQTLQDPSLPRIEVPYDRLPWITLNAWGTGARRAALGFTSELVNFRRAGQTEGQRVVAYPQVSLPMSTAAAYVTPKIGLNFSRYQLTGQPAGTPAQLTRTLPIASVDSGLNFERDTDWDGHAVTQTLEPRLFYLYVPFRDQSLYPVFDTAEADFNFTQIFSENTFVGKDRIADANHVTAALSSRLINAASGADVIRAMVGQRFYFRTPTVTLPGVAPPGRRSSDLLAAASGRITPALSVEAAWQYNPQENRNERFNLSGRYLPEFGRVLNASYRYQSGVVREIDTSAQWPLGGRWSGVGRYNYSFQDNRLVEAIGGLEYDGGCWVLRTVLHRFATATQTANTALFVQLELNGLSRIGSNPLALLKRSISGYGRINQPVADPVFGAP